MRHRRQSISADFFEKFCVYLLRSDLYCGASAVDQIYRFPLEISDIENLIEKAAINTVCAQELINYKDAIVIDEKGIPLSFNDKERRKILKKAERYSKPAIAALCGLPPITQHPYDPLAHKASTKFDRLVDAFLRPYLVQEVKHKD
ncbi:MAG: hypothetical protein V4568_02070 [Pseudomonadota bacterium]